MPTPDSLPNLTPAACIVNCLAKGPTKRFAGYNKKWVEFFHTVNYKMFLGFFLVVFHVID